MRGLAVITGSQIPHIRKHIGKPAIIADNGDLIVTDEHTHKVEVLRNGAADHLPLITEEGLDRARTYWACLGALEGADGAHEHTDSIVRDAAQAADDILDSLMEGLPAQTHDERLTEIVQCQAIRDYREAQR